jgi:hypothetical protein
VRQKDPAITATRPLEIFLYHVSVLEPVLFDLPVGASRSSPESGFTVNPRSERCRNIDAVIAYCGRLEAERDHSTTTRTAQSSRSTTSSSADSAPPPTIPLGHRLQVRRPSGDDPGEGITINVGQDQGALTPAAQPGPSSWRGHREQCQSPQ